MAGINQGVPETAIGEPIRLGSNNEFEIEQHPVSDRLIIRDTVNGKVAYVRKERGGQIGGDGVLIKALKEGKPMADDGRTYDTIQQAEREASSWVFVPPGTYNESVKINTKGLTLRGSGYNTVIDGGSSDAVVSNENRVTVRDFTLRTNTSDGGRGLEMERSNTVMHVNFSETGSEGIAAFNPNVKIIGNKFESGVQGEAIAPFDESAIINGNKIESASNGIFDSGSNTIISNNVIQNCGSNGIFVLNGDGDSIVIANRIMNCSDNGIDINGDNTIVANNRVSDSVNTDISDSGTNTVLDSNLTGASN